MEFSSARWQTIFKFNITVYDRSLIVTSHVWACKVFVVFVTLSSRDENVKNISKISSRSWDRWNPTIAMLPQMTRNQRKLNDERCEWVWWETEWFCRSCSVFHVICRYFDRFLLQGVCKNWRQACFFYLALGLICEGYWQVNSRMSIFRIADPT